MQTDHQTDTTERRDAVFTAHEARVLACLMEKELSVPDSYPLTLNSLTLACNQKSNREPKMQLSEGEVGHVAKELENRAYVRIEYGERVHRFEHAMRKMLNLDKRQQSVLTVLMLRAPQTLNDLKVRTRRMNEFADIDEIQEVLESLNAGEVPLMQHIPRAAGQREDRYTHLLCGEPDVAPAPASREFMPPEAEDDRLQALQAQLDALTARLEKLESLFGED